VNFDDEKVTTILFIHWVYLSLIIFAIQTAIVLGLYEVLSNLMQALATTW
jgi:hypothetical protein